MTDEIPNSGPPFGMVSNIIQLLDPLPPKDREHVLRTVTTWFRVGLSSAGELHAPAPAQPIKPAEDEKFSNRSVLSVKDFIFEKNPATEGERMACLAYYLAHYMETPHFKTVDLTRLNADAAQRTFSNPAVAANNAMRDGYFVLAPKVGYKQLSAMGERFVHALPDREAAQQIKQRTSHRRGRKTRSLHEDSAESESVNQLEMKG